MPTTLVITKSAAPEDRPVDVALGREVHDGVDLGHQPVDQWPVEDVALDDAQPLVVAAPGVRFSMLPA